MISVVSWESAIRSKKTKSSVMKKKRNIIKTKLFDDSGQELKQAELQTPWILGSDGGEDMAIILFLRVGTEGWDWRKQMGSAL